MLQQNHLVCGLEEVTVQRAQQCTKVLYTLINTATSINLVHFSVSLRSLLISITPFLFPCSHLDSSTPVALVFSRFGSLSNPGHALLDRLLDHQNLRQSVSLGWNLPPRLRQIRHVTKHLHRGSVAATFLHPASCLHHQQAPINISRACGDHFFRLHQAKPARARMELSRFESSTMHVLLRVMMLIFCTRIQLAC